jgi:hypothetical protein
LAEEFNGMHVCLPAEHERNHPYVFLSAKLEQIPLDFRHSLRA